MKTALKRMMISFLISSFAGLIVNLAIDIIVNATGTIDQFTSIAPDFVARFSTPIMAAYVNILLYGLIGLTFSGMTFVFEFDRLGFVLQYLIYFCVTGLVLAFITMYLWKLQNVPQALAYTLLGYGITFLIIGICQYRMIRQDIQRINESIESEI